MTRRIDRLPEQVPVNEDTQPRSPFDTQPQPTAPGCLAWGLVGTAGVAFSLMVVVLSAVAGYSAGLDVVDRSAASTREAFVQEQLNVWIPRDLESGNVALLEARVDGLASLTPSFAEMPGLVATATQFALDMQPTASSTPTQPPVPTITATEAVQQATAVPTSAAPDGAPVYDVAALFAEAQGQVDAGQYQDAAETLDAIMGIDPTFQSETVRELMLEALRAEALRNFRNGNLAQGIIVANQAETYGDIGDLNYERYVAGLYLDATSSIGSNDQLAIERLSELYALQPDYADVRQTLFNLRVSVGDRFLEAFDFCAAYAQYQAALQIQFSGDVEQKLAEAEENCAQPGQAPLSGTPGNAPATQDTPEPVGQPAPIGQRD